MMDDYFKEQEQKSRGFRRQSQLQWQSIAITTSA